MKRREILRGLLIALGCVGAGYLLVAAPDAPPSGKAGAATNAAVKTPAKGSLPPDVPLTEDQIKELQGQQEISPGVRLVFAAVCQRYTPTPGSARLMEKTGKVPFIVYPTLSEIRALKDRFVTTLQPGTFTFYLRDKDGNVVASKSSVPLRASSSHGDAVSGGYQGEVAKPGSYTCVVWTDYKGKGRFGTVLPADLNLPKKP